MSQFSAVAIIYNPNSTGNAPANAEQLQSELQNILPKLSVTLLPTERAGHAIELAYDFAKQHQDALIISASGDGGYNEVINGALRAQNEGAQPICAVLPSGNANDHARTIHDRPLSELIQAESVTNLDVLKVTATHADSEQTQRYAHSYIGVGLTPTVAVELNKHTLNSLKEAWIIIKTFWSLQPVRLRIDGKTEQLDSLICSTIPEMAKVLTISKKAQPQDGLFEVTLIRHHSKFALVFRLVKGMFKHLGAAKRTDRYTFTNLLPAPLQLDGEVMELEAGTEVRVEMCAGLLRTIAPTQN